MRFLMVSAVSTLSLCSSGVVRLVDAVLPTNDNPLAPKVTWKTPDSPYASYLGSLMAAAHPTPDSQLRRRIEDGEIDLTSYSIKFEKCLYIKQYDTEHNDGTLFATQKLVVFRLCPDDGGTCSNNSCKSNYGEYIVDMDTYLESMLQHKKNEQDAYCEACQSCASVADNDGARDRHRRPTTVDCDTCHSQCQRIDDMEEHGYVDAAEYYHCKKVYKNRNTGVVYYAGAMCANSGARITVGLFTDEYCEDHDADASPDQYIKKNGYNVKLSHYLMRQTFATENCLASCTGTDDNDVDGDGNYTETKTAEVCRILYEAAGKCETPHKFVSGMGSNSDYHLQVANEDTVCKYIAKIHSGAYDETGKLVVKTSTLHINGGTMYVTVKTTGRQKFALTFVVIGTVAFVAHAAFLRQRVKKCKRKGIMSPRVGGAMA